jgi:hypothetical protein
MRVGSSSLRGETGSAVGKEDLCRRARRTNLRGEQTAKGHSSQDFPVVDLADDPPDRACVLHFGHSRHACVLQREAWL